MVVLRWKISRFVSGLVVLALALAGCNSAGVPGQTEPDPNGTDGLQVEFNDDTSTDLAVSAVAGDGAELAIYGAKDADGQLESVTQIDSTSSDDGTVTSIELDDQGRPVRMEDGSGGGATFSYDEDAGTVRVEVQDSSGNTSVSEEASTLDEGTAGRSLPFGHVGRTTSDRLCQVLGSARRVLKQFFDCQGAADPAFCRERFARISAFLDELCDTPIREVQDLATSLGRKRHVIPLGVRAHFTTRGGADAGTTAVLVGVGFGGVRPYDSLSWSSLAGPADVAIENLPGGTAIADLLLPGTYTFRVIATDAEGGQAAADIEVPTGGVSDLVIQFEPERPAVGQVVTFSGFESSPPPDDPFEFYHWRFGDGWANAGAEVSHAFDAEGEFVVSMLVSTRRGQRATATVVVRVGEPVDCEAQCQMDAEEIFLDCLLAGGSEDECAERSRRILEGCIQEFCGGEFDCSLHCQEQAEHVFEECVDDGNSEAECGIRAAEFLLQCLREQCQEPPECERQCRDMGEGLFFECREAGGSRPECMDEVFTFMEDCLAENCDHVEDCLDRCIRQGERVFVECRHNGGNEEECAQRSIEHVDRCREEQCYDPGDCREACETHARDVFAECVADGGDEVHCEDRAREFFENCVENECEGPGDCERICEEEIRRFMDHCRNDGRPLDECDAEARTLREICLRQECDSLPDCELACEQGARFFFQDCLFNGGDPDDCLEQAEGIFEECVRLDCQDVGCEETCYEQVPFVFDRCVEEGGGPEECDEVAQRFLEDCLHSECGQAPGCEQRCQDDAERALDDCFFNGGTDEECGELFHDVFQFCLDEQCHGGEPPECQWLCEEQSQWMYDGCIAGGGSDEECTGVMRGAFDMCMQRECGEQGEPRCEDFCGDHADFIFRECLANGTPEDVCGRESAEAFDRCLVEECGHQPGPTADCEGSCDRSAGAVFDGCLATGEPTDVCESLRTEAFHICITDECDDTPPPPPTDDCDAICRVDSDIVRDRCLMTDGAPADCETQAAVVFQACLDDRCGQPPLPPPSAGDDCGVGCEDNSQLVFDACIDEGLSADQCEERRRVEQDACVARQCG